MIPAGHVAIPAHRRLSALLLSAVRNPAAVWSQRPPRKGVGTLEPPPRCASMGGPKGRTHIAASCEFCNIESLGPACSHWKAARASAIPSPCQQAALGQTRGFRHLTLLPGLRPCCHCRGIRRTARCVTDGSLHTTPPPSLSPPSSRAAATSSAFVVGPKARMRRRMGQSSR